MVYAMTRKELLLQNSLAQMKNVEQSVLFKVRLAREITYDMRKWQYKNKIGKPRNNISRPGNV